MTASVYSFDLGIQDYVAMNMHSCKGIKRYFQGAIPWAGVVLIGAFFFLVVVGHMIPDSAMGIAGPTAIVFFLVWPFVWRYRHRVRLRRYYSQAPIDRLLGPHTLTIGSEGIESTGPYHRTFRAWPAVTGACVAAEQTLIYTIYGNIYILPARAVADRAEVRRALEAHLPSSVVRDA